MRLFVVETCNYDEDGESCGCGVFLIKSETKPTCFDIKKSDKWKNIKNKLGCESISEIYEVDMAELEKWKCFMIVEL